MADSNVPITSGSGTNIDTRTESTSGHHRQVVVLGDPAVNDNVAAVVTQDVGYSNQSSPAALVRLAGSAGVKIVGVDTANTLGIYLDSMSGTARVRFSDEPTVVAAGKQGTTTRHLLMNTDGAVKVYDLNYGTVKVDAANSSGTLGVYLSGTSGTLQVKLDPDSTLGGIRTTIGVRISETAGTIQVKLDPASKIAGSDSSIAVYFDRSKPIVLADSQHTAGIFTVSGSTSGGLTSGVTLISPSASYNFKIFAYSLQTTGIVSSTWRFTNGGESATEFWRPLSTEVLTASAARGANLAVQPPGYLFATGTNVTLALKTDNASLVHYSVSYIKESA